MCNLLQYYYFIEIDNNKITTTAYNKHNDCLGSKYLLSNLVKSFVCIADEF